MRDKVMRCALTGRGARVSLGASVSSLALLACIGAAGRSPVTPEIDIGRALADEAREALALVPDGRGGIATRLAEALARRGAVEEARAIVQSLGSSWYPYARVATAQRDSGDFAGALATARLIPDVEGRSQAIADFASSYAYSGDLDRLFEVAHMLESPKQQVQLLRDYALGEALGRNDAAARAALEEAVRIARSDTSSSGRFFELDLAYLQARAGDLQSAVRILADTLSPAERSARLANMASAVRQRTGWRSPNATADSLFREALAAADAVVDSTSRVRLRKRVFERYAFYTDTSASRVMVQVSETPEERARALLTEATTRANRAQDLHGALAAVGELDAMGAHREAALALAATVSVFPNRRETGHGVYLPDLPPMWDTIIVRAVNAAELISEAFGDTLRARIVVLVSFQDAHRAAVLAGEIVDQRLRARAMRVAAGGLLSTDPEKAATLSASMAPSAQRDTLRWLVSQHFALRRQPTRALEIASGIGSEAVRAQALAYGASALLARGDTIQAIAVYEEALAATDPEADGLGRSLVRALQALGELPRLRAWARSQPTPKRRAAALVLVLETLPF